MSPSADAIIIGGGIIGCSLAESLAAAGMKVTLFERGSLGREASWAAAGMLAPQSEMPEPGPYLDFCLASRRMYETEVARLREFTGIDPQYRTEGMFYAARNEEEAEVLRQRATWQKACGLGIEMMTIDAARKIEPALTNDAAMVVHFQEDHQIDARLLTRAYSTAAQKRNVAIIEQKRVVRVLHEGTRITGVATAQNKFLSDRVIVTAGCWSGTIEGIAPLVPTYPVKGQMLLLQTPTPIFNHTLHSTRVYLVPRIDGRVVVGATEEHEAGFDQTVHSGAISDLLLAAFELAPSLRRAALADTWAGLRPGTPDRRPILGKGLYDGLFLATGHFRNGVLLAPITAHRMTSMIVSGIASEDIQPFSPERFERK